MNRILLLLAPLLVALAIMPSPRQATAIPPWPPLLNCPDVDGDGGATINDIFAVARKFGTQYPSTDYMVLYDADGGGAITLSDIFLVASQFGQYCPLIETQVAMATLATEKYRDWPTAQADGYVKGTQYVTQMGIHVARPGWLKVAFDPTEPVGLIYTDDGSGQPDKLIGLWYVVPIPEVCATYAPDPNSGLFGVNPLTCSTAEPVGFGLTNTDEDNQDVNAIQKTWHDHTGLCLGDLNLVTAWVTENGAGSENYCLNDTPGPGPGGDNGDLWFGTYGWMVHLYNFIPNPTGRFVMWNSNLP